MAVTYTAPNVSYSECELPTRSPSEGHDGERFRATRVLECAWDNRLTLMEQLLGAYSIDSSGRVFRVGDVYPHRSGVYVESIPRIEGYGQRAADGSGNSRWKKARLTVNYAQRSFNPDADSSGGSVSDLALFDETIDGSIQVIAVPADKKLFWADGTPIRDADVPLRQESVMRWSVNWTEEIPVASNLLSLAGQTNTSSITSVSLGLTFAAETLYYQFPTIQRTVFESGTNLANVSVEFLYKPSGWNKFFQPGVQASAAIYTDAGASSQFKPIAPGNLGALEIGA